ncbi:MAG: 3-phenylpropionate/trans-cinnamate dioxygenase ferredoxin reductase component [Microbacteriaceae bacterium]|nr:3-phenylpropionate/trans-cinnamate dioxygenase ferredoxin reductase component [Microbacteriaceae bacterium]
MKEHGTVIAGAGLAGATAAEGLRSEGYAGPITMIGSERDAPYLRPPLSKAFLAGAEGEDALPVQPPAWYREQQVDLRTSVTVERLSRQDRVLVCSDGSVVPYDRLLIATGASPRRLPLSGTDLDGVVYLRTVEESRHLQSVLHRSPGEAPARLVLIGSGWIGMEVAATARTLGAEVTVVGMEAVPLGAAIGPELGGVFLRRHQAEGVRFHLSETVRGIVGAAGRVTGVQLGSGETAPADVVVIAIGAVPNVQIAEGTGLGMDNGIRVGDTLRTNDASIWAAGDVASVYQPALGRYQRFEHWANAIATGSRAARSMLGLPVGPQELPYFYTDQFDVGMEYWGHPSLAASAKLILRGDPDSGAFVAFWVTQEGPSAGAVVAGMHVNVWDSPDEIKHLITSQEPVDPTVLAGTTGRAA